MWHAPCVYIYPGVGLGSPGRPARPLLATRGTLPTAVGNMGMMTGMNTHMRYRSRVGLAVLWAVLIVGSTHPATCGPSEDEAGNDTRSESRLRFEEACTWRLEFDNDVIFDSDNQFSNGWSLQKYGPPKHDWAAVGGTLAVGKRVAKWFLPERRTDLYFREGWALGQNIQTPDDLSAEQVIEDDVPYAASLAVQNTWAAFDDRHFRGFGWLLGIVGPPALGEEVQAGFHRLIESQEPMGWDNQLGTEPLINLYYEWKEKVWSTAGFDGAAAFGAQAGNFLTGAEIAVETRCGWNIPKGFVYIPDPVGRSLSFDAQMPPPSWARSVLYASVVARGVAVAHALFLDGSTFRDGHSADRETLVGELILGLHYQRRKWGIHLNLWYTTDVIDSRTVKAQPDPSNDFGTLMFEVRF